MRAGARTRWTTASRIWSPGDHVVDAVPSACSRTTPTRVKLHAKPSSHTLLARYPVGAPRAVQMPPPHKGRHDGTASSSRIASPSTSVSGNTTVGTTGRSACRSSAISTRPLLHGRDGSTRGCAVESERRCTGWGASRDGIRTCLPCGSWVYGLRLEGRSRMRRESHVRFCRDQKRRCNPVGENPNMTRARRMKRGRRFAGESRGRCLPTNLAKGQGAILRAVGIERCTSLVRRDSGCRASQILAKAAPAAETLADTATGPGGVRATARKKGLY